MSNLRLGDAFEDQAAVSKCSNAIAALAPCQVWHSIPSDQPFPYEQAVWQARVNVRAFQTTHRRIWHSWGRCTGGTPRSPPGHSPPRNPSRHLPGRPPPLHLSGCSWHSLGNAGRHHPQGSSLHNFARGSAVGIGGSTRCCLVCTSGNTRQYLHLCLTQCTTARWQNKVGMGPMGRGNGGLSSRWVRSIRGKPLLPFSQTFPDPWLVGG